MSLRGAGPAILALLSLFGGAAGAQVRCTDAEFVALDYSGELEAPADLVAMAGADLASIRAYDPYFEDILPRPEWLFTWLELKLTAWAFEDFRAGEYHGLDVPNGLYGPVELEEMPVVDWIRAVFPRCYNLNRLRDIYAAADGVLIAETPYVIEGDGIAMLSPGHYLFTHGWGDCPSGCFYYHYWEFEVTGGEVVLLREWGDEVRADAMTWGDLRLLWAP